MKIYTRKGDGGETSLIGGKRVRKDDIRIDAYGTVDELNSFLGLIRDSAKDRSREEEIREIQNRLFTLGSELATAPEGSKMKLPSLQTEDIEMLEHAIAEMETKLPELKNFILPGGNLTASHCHVARCVCRRAERKTIELSAISALDDKILQYLNRLSDYLFTLARFFTYSEGGEETLWKTRN